MELFSYSISNLNGVAQMINPTRIGKITQIIMHLGGLVRWSPTVKICLKRSHD